MARLEVLVILKSIRTWLRGNQPISGIVRNPTLTRVNLKFLSEPELKVFLNLCQPAPFTLARVGLLRPFLRNRQPAYLDITRSLRTSIHGNLPVPERNGLGTYNTLRVRQPRPLREGGLEAIGEASRHHGSEGLRPHGVRG